MGSFWKLGHNTFRTFWEHQNFKIIKIIFKSTLELSLIISQNWFWPQPKIEVSNQVKLLRPKTIDQENWTQPQNQHTLIFEKI
jgi:hypothetical protein